MLTIAALVDAGTFTYANGTNFSYAVRYLYPADLNGDGLDEIIFAGFETQFNTPANYTNTRITIFGWKNGTFQDVSADWLPNGAGNVEGVGEVGYGDFNGDGKLDVFLSAFADMDYPANVYMLINRGNSLEKIQLENINALQHGIAVADVNHDGYADVFSTGYGPYRLYLGSATGLTINPLATFAGGSGVALGDFLGDGTTTAILVDHMAASGQDGALYKFVQNGPLFDIAYVSTLPPARIDLPLYGPIASPLGHSHDIRAIPFDFSHDGLADVIVISAASADLVQQLGHRVSEVQFLRNNGSGIFQDVTEHYLKGYDHRAGSSYHPVLIDANNDGLTDIFLSEADWTTTHISTCILMQQKDGTFVSTGAAAFSQWIAPDGGIASILRGPQQKKYLLVEYQTDGGLASVKIAELSFADLTATISGTPAEGQLLTVNVVAHADGLGAMSFLWKANGTPIGSGTSYLLTQAEIGKTMTVTASYINSAGLAETASSSATAAVTGLVDPATGSVIVGDSGGNILTGAAGNDTLTGKAGIDIFNITAGIDAVLDLGKGGADVLNVAAGATVHATVKAAWTASAATLNLGTANILTSGFAVNLTAVTLGNGFNLTSTGPRKSVLAGSGLSDLLTGHNGKDNLSGSSGDDTLAGGRGADKLSGGDGCDTFIFSPGDTSRAKNCDVLNDYAKGAVGVADMINYSADLRIGGSDAAAARNQASINALTGVASFFPASGATLGDALTDMASGFSAAGDAVGEFALFRVKNAGDYYLFISDGVAGVSADDLLIRLVGITSVENIDLANGNLTILT